MREMREMGKMGEMREMGKMGKMGEMREMREMGKMGEMREMRGMGEMKKYFLLNLPNQGQEDTVKSYINYLNCLLQNGATTGDCPYRYVSNIFLSRY
jgi:spore coat protein CotH